MVDYSKTVPSYGGLHRTHLVVTPLNYRQAPFPLEAGPRPLPYFRTLQTTRDSGIMACWGVDVCEAEREAWAV